MDGREEGVVGATVVRLHVRVECQREQLGEHMGDILHGDGGQVGDVVLTGIEPGKDLLDDMERSMEYQHQFAGFVVVLVEGFGVAYGFTRAQVVKRDTHRDTMDSRIFFIVHKRQAVERRGGLDPLHRTLLLQTPVNDLFDRGLIGLECLGQGKLGVPPIITNTYNIIIRIIPFDLVENLEGPLPDIPRRHQLIDFFPITDRIIFLVYNLEHFFLGKGKQTERISFTIYISSTFFIF